MDWVVDLLNVVAIGCLIVSIKHIREASAINKGLPKTILIWFFITLAISLAYSLFKRYQELPAIPVLGDDYIMDVMQHLTPVLFLLLMNSLAQSRTISDLEKKGAQMEVRERHMEDQQSALLKLSRFSGDTRTSVRRSTEIAAEALNVYRVGVWLYDEKKTKIVCEDLFELDKATHSQGIELLAEDYPRYFEALQSGHLLDAYDAFNDERTKEFADGYLKDYNIHSMMDTAISIKGSVIGILCFENQFLKRQWTVDEKNFARAIADIISLHLEVEENKRIGDELRREKTIARHYFDTVEVLIVSVDLDGIIEEINRKACEILGYEESELIGKRWSETCVPEFARNSVRERYGRIMKGEQEIPQYIEDPMLTRSGEIRLVRWQGAFNRDFENKVTGALIVGEDVTDERKQEEERDKLERQLHQMQKMDTIGRLTGGIAHDFNNMLASIMGYTEMAQLDARNKGLSELASTLERIYSVGERAAELVSHLMLYTRSNEVEMHASNVNDIVSESLTILKSTIPSSIELVSDTESDLPLISGNSGQLQQVIMNLALNARDALDCESPRISIATSKTRIALLECDSCYEQFDGNFICLTVSDNGSGIEPALQRDVFTPFMTTKESGKGTGMGLSIVHGIVHMHGGHLSLTSNPGEGTTIKVFLRIPNEALEGKNQKLEETPNPARVLYDTQDKRVLLVDDEEDVVNLLSEFLSLKGIDVSRHTSSEAALIEFEANPDSFSAIVTDHTMPKVSGLELIKRVRNQRKEIPVVMCSGGNDFVSQENIDELGIAHIYQKPVSFRKLVDDVANMIHHN